MIWPIHISPFSKKTINAKTCTVLWPINLPENDSNEKKGSIIFGAKKG